MKAAIIALLAAVAAVGFAAVATTSVVVTAERSVTSR